MPGFHTDLTGLTDSEISALSLSIGTARVRQLGLDVPLASALRKLTAALPEQRREAAFRIGLRIMVDPDGWLPGTSVPWLSETRQAVMDQTTISFRCQSATTGRTERVTAPAIGLLCAANTW